MARNLPAAIKPASENKEQKRNLRQYCYLIERYFGAYDFIVRVMEVNMEPFGIQICMETAIGTPVKNILKHQIALAKLLGAPRQKITMEAPIPGRYLIGITIPWVYPEPAAPRTLVEKQQHKATGNNLMKLSIRMYTLAEKFGGHIFYQI